MSLNLAASPQSYRESAILTASPERLVVMLYDGARRFLTQAAAMRAGDVPTAHERLRRAEAIVEHLSLTLDLDQGEIAVRLQAIYAFGVRHLAAGRMERDADKLDAVNTLLGELRGAWEQAISSIPNGEAAAPAGVR